MFPERPVRPNQPYPLIPNRRPYQMPPVQKKQSLLTQFKTADGNFDFDKITATAQQVQGIYTQVSPMIKQVSPLITKYIKK
ncbi:MULTISPECIES: YppG family protein [Paraliobacillus]|uniref:YppG family protein n=1 Tax=Paraliobacillus TaxID=200903 RepID=UPI000DD2BE67|nr:MULTISPECIES: YppG family protein [Paraliobacillus]